LGSGVRGRASTPRLRGAHPRGPALPVVRPRGWSCGRRGRSSLSSSVTDRTRGGAGVLVGSNPSRSVFGRISPPGLVTGGAFLFWGVGSAEGLRPRGCAGRTRAARPCRSAQGFAVLLHGLRANIARVPCATSPTRVSSKCLLYRSPRHAHVTVPSDDSSIRLPNALLGDADRRVLHRPVNAKVAPACDSHFARQPKTDLDLRVRHFTHMDVRLLNERPRTCGDPREHNVL